MSDIPTFKIIGELKEVSAYRRAYNIPDLPQMRFTGEIGNLTPLVPGMEGYEDAPYELRYIVDNELQRVVDRFYKNNPLMT